MNFVVVTVFWPMLFHVVILKVAGDQLKIFNVYWAHIVPGLSVVVNFLLTDVKLRAKHCIVLPIPGILYATVNYFETKSRGTPLYWFLTWKDYTSVVISFGLITGCMLVFVGLSALTVAMKQSVNDSGKPGKERESKANKSR